MKCYSCEIELKKQNKSIEHIFINAIGGRLKSGNILCKDCNNGFGSKLDSELAKQCNILMNFLELEREKGSFQPIVGKTKDGEEYILEGAGLRSKSKINIEKDENRVNVSFNGSEEKELKKYFTQLSKKYPQVDVDEVLIEALKSQTKYYLNEPVNINFNIGGETALRAIAKIAVNYYAFNNGKIDCIRPVIDYVKLGGKSKYSQYFYYINNDYLKVSDNKIYHYIKLIGASDERISYCYIELFGALKFIVILSLDYEGENMDYEYYYNLISNTQEKISISINLNRDNLKNAIEGKHVQISDISESLNEVFKVGQKRQGKKHISKLIKEASKKTLWEHEGKPITEDILNEFIYEISKSMAIYMTRNNHNQKKTYFK